MKNIIEQNKIRIISGEGEQGTIEEYTGKKTLRALKLRLARERYYGERWARAEIYCKDSWIKLDL